MSLSIRFKNQVKSLIYSLLAWQFAGLLYVTIRFMGTYEHADWAINGLTVALVGFLGGSLMGLFYWGSIVLSNSNLMRNRSYGFLIIMQIIVMLLVMVLIVWLTKVLAYIDGRITYDILFTDFIQKLKEPLIIALFVYISFMAFLISFIRQMSLMIGQNTLINILLGKYYNPIEENRIFMFLDLKSSTTIAEKLGHYKFCKLIQDCFRDLTDSAVKHEAEIYQYVGDEAILTWNIKDGIKKGNCLHVFFDFLKSLEDRSEYYNQNYGLIPQFKAGINLGAVTVAEVGVIKRNIAYLSDVLNTAARIEAKCNEYMKPLLVSSKVKHLIGDDSGFIFELLGELELRGKNEKVGVYSVSIS